MDLLFESGFTKPCTALVMADKKHIIKSVVVTLIDDMAHFGDGHEIPRNFLDFFSLTVELAYRELVVLDFIEDFNSTQKEVIDIVRQCLMMSRELHILTESSEPSSFIMHTGTVGRPRYDISVVADRSGPIIDSPRVY